MKETITDEKIIETLPEEEGQEYQRLKGVEKLANNLGKEVSKEVKEKIEGYRKKVAEIIETTNELEDNIEARKEKIKDTDDGAKEKIISHKELIENIREEMKQLKKKELQDLEEVDKQTNISDNQKKARRKEIIERFHVNMEKLKERKGYNEAIKSAKEEGEIRGKIRKIKSDISKQKKQLDELEKKHYEKKLNHGLGIESIMNTNFEAMEKYLKKYCVEINEGIEFDGKTFKKVSIELPKINGYPGKKYEFYMLQGEGMDIREFRLHGYNRKSYSEKEIIDILENIRKFATEIGIPIDENINYKRIFYTSTFATKCLTNLLGIKKKQDYRINTSTPRIPNLFQIHVNKVIKTYDNGFKIGHTLDGGGYEGYNFNVLLKSLPNRQEILH